MSSNGIRFDLEGLSPKAKIHAGNYPAVRPTAGTQVPSPDIGKNYPRTEHTTTPARTMTRVGRFKQARTSTSGVSRINFDTRTDTTCTMRRKPVPHREENIKSHTGGTVPKPAGSPFFQIVN